MSHLKERKEKNCLNCNATVYGKYCHICGQENIETKETAWHLVTHFFQDITHFDGKFFSTIKYLISRPGFVSKEYIIGRRASYLNPVRMYVFTSAIFFLVFFTLYHFEQENGQRLINKKTETEIAAMDSTTFDTFTRALNKGKPMTRADFKVFVDSSSNSRGLHFSNNRYKSREEYDSLLKAGVAKDNWLERLLIYKEIGINEKYQGNQQKILSAFVNILMHSFPQMLFVSLPIFALLLRLLYVRRKGYFYVNHVIFSIHLYVFIFIQLFLIMGLSQLKDITNWSWLNWPIVLCYIGIFFYEYKAMRFFYAQRRAKTIVKFFALNFMHLVVLILLFIIFTFFSLLKI